MFRMYMISGTGQCTVMDIQNPEDKMRSITHENKLEDIEVNT